MIVCLCHGVSERVIRQAAQQGAGSVKDVGRACGAGTGCGACVDDVEQVLAECQGQARCASLAILTGVTLAATGQAR